MTKNTYRFGNLFLEHHMPRLTRASRRRIKFGWHWQLHAKNNPFLLPGKPKTYWLTFQRKNIHSNYQDLAFMAGIKNKLHVQNGYVILDGGIKIGN